MSSIYTKKIKQIAPFCSLIPISLFYLSGIHLFSGFLSIFIPLSLSLLILLLTNLCILKKEKELRVSFLIFSTLLMLSLIRIIPGIDVTDTGFAVTKAWGFNLEGSRSDIDFMWVTNWISSLWLRIPGQPSLLWAKFGFALISSLTGLLAYLSFRRFKGITTYQWLAIAVSTWCMTTFQLHIPNYNNFPTLLISCASLLLINGFMTETGHGKGRLIFGGSFIIGISMHSRLPFILYLLLPLCFFLYSLLYRKKGIRNPFCSGLQLLGILSGFSSMFIVLIMMGRFDDYVSTNLAFFLFHTTSRVVEDSNSELHGFSRLLQLNLKQIVHVGVPFVILAIAHFTLLKKKRIFQSNLFRFVFIAILFLLVHVESIVGFSFPKYTILGSIAYIFFVYGLNHHKDEDYMMVLAIALYVVFTGLLSSLGSDQGFITIFTSGGIIFPLYFAFILFQTKLSGTAGLQSSAFFFRLNLLYWVIISCTILPYRDFRWYDRASVSDHRVLQGLLSSKARINALDSLLDYVEEEDIGHDSKVLVLNTAPLLYFCLDTPSRLENNWGPWLSLNPVKAIEQALNQAVLIDYDYIILAVKAQRNAFWPDVETPTVMEGYDRKYELMTDWIESLGQSPDFSNGTYSVYKL